MYDFIDRRLIELDNGGRFLIWATRFWVRSLHRNSCPTNDIQSAFDQRAIGDALGHFNMAMVILNCHSLENLGFGDVHCRTVHEGEALLLSVMTALRNAPAEQVRDTVSLMVEPAWTAPLIAALSALADRLNDVGLTPGLPRRLPYSAGGRT